VKPDSPKRPKPLGEKMGQISHFFPNPACSLLDRPAKNHRENQGKGQAQVTPKRQYGGQIYQNYGAEQQEQQIVQEANHSIHQECLDFRYVGAKPAQQVTVTEVLHPLDPRIQAMVKQPLPDFNQHTG